MKLEDAILEVYYWQYSKTSSFYNQLCDLYMKADSNNKGKLTGAYPEICIALNMWMNAGDYGNDLFREHGIMDA